MNAPQKGPEKSIRAGLQSPPLLVGKVSSGVWEQKNRRGGETGNHIKQFTLSRRGEFQWLSLILIFTHSTNFYCRSNTYWSNKGKS